MIVSQVVHGDHFNRSHRGGEWGTKCVNEKPLRRQTGRCGVWSFWVIAEQEAPEVELGSAVTGNLDRACADTPAEWEPRFDERHGDASLA